MKHAARHSLLIALTTGLLLSLGSLAGRAGDYHYGATLVCSDCHVMHYSQQHGYSGGGPEPLAGGPYGKLLKADPNALCLTCHDGATGGGNIAPDVMQAAGPGQAAHRAAGAFPEQPGTQTANGHSLLVSAVPPGGTTAMSLTCTSCHAPHGNSSYRNLVPNPGGASGLAVTAVSQAQKTPTATHYEVGNLRYTSNDGGLSAWCGGCHGNFHGAGGAANMGGSNMGDTNQTAVSPWLRHPTRDVTMGQGVSNQHIDAAHWFGSLSSRVPVVSVSGVIPGSGAGSDNQVFCGTCHKAHGSTHPYGLIWDNAATAEPEDGAAEMDTCQQCHYK